MNALSIVNKVISLVSYNMHKSRRDAVTACVKSVLSGSAATVTSIGRGINTKALSNNTGIADDVSVTRSYITGYDARLFK
ncbi:hypothetical protein [Alteromonas macleodii]|uniref:hypothetical protein n=1 Tax=Alteromonas macleodii TaxID=28108 RepID=UPI0019309DD4|nr:hypothetical protein [Alteromonas macleodii]MEC8231138.1 hypothetical protein [Pseudomonadota bacterium]